MTEWFDRLAAAGGKAGGVPALGYNGLPQGMDLENWQTAPYLGWTFQHMADFLPTEPIGRGDGPVADLNPAPAGLESIVVPLPDLGGPRTVADVMATTDTDAWMVLHDGKILAEHYVGEMRPDSSHLLMSVSKSLVGVVAGVLVGDGTLDPHRTLESYIPRLAGTGYAEATVRDLLDMRSGIRYSEEYLDPQAEVRQLEQVIGWAPRRNHALPDTMYEFLASLERKGPHGGPFEYRSCETDALGWVCEAAAGRRMPELMSEVLWSKLGAEHEARIAVDPEGSGMFDGGVNATLRDLARFGSLFLNEGVSPTGERVVGAGWIADTFAGGPDSREAFAESPGDNRMPGGMYRNQVWFPYPGNNVALCLGIHGQMIYINRTAGLVGVKLSAWPLPQDAVKLFSTLQAFDAIAATVHAREHAAVAVAASLAPPEASGTAAPPEGPGEPAVQPGSQPAE